MAASVKKWDFENFVWQEKSMTVRHLVDNYSRRVPFLVKFVSGYYGRDEDLHYVSGGEVCWLHDVVAQERVVVRNETGEHYSIPLSFKRKVQAVVDNHTSRSKISIKDMVTVSKQGKFVFAADKRGSQLYAFRGADQSAVLLEGVLEIVDTYKERFLSLHHLKTGGLQETLRLIPAYMPVDVVIAVGVQSGSREEFIEDMLLLKACSDSLKHDYSAQRKLLSYILVFDRQHALQEYEFQLPLYMYSMERRQKDDTTSAYGSLSAASVASSMGISPGGGWEPAHLSADHNPQSQYLSVRGRDHMRRLYGPDPDEDTMSHHGCKGSRPIMEIPVLQELHNTLLSREDQPASPGLGASPGGLQPRFFGSADNPPVRKYGPKQLDLVKKALPPPTACKPKVKPGTRQMELAGRERPSAPPPLPPLRPVDSDRASPLSPTSPKHVSSSSDESGSRSSSEGGESNVHRLAFFLQSSVKDINAKSNPPPIVMKPSRGSSTCTPPVTSPMMSPVTSPMMSPVTSPMMSPVTSPRGSVFQDPPPIPIRKQSVGVMEAPTSPTNPNIANTQPTNENLANVNLKPRGPITSPGDIPRDISTLNSDEIGQCLALLEMGQYRESFKRDQIDGELLKSLDAELLKTEFSMGPFHVKKLLKFIDGWRPS